MTKPLDFTKPIRTRDGKGKVVIYCTDAPDEFPIHGRIEFNGGVVLVSRWCANGENFVIPDYSLVNVPEPLTVWITIDGDHVSVWKNEKGAKNHRLSYGGTIHKFVIENPEVSDE